MSQIRKHERKSEEGEHARFGSDIHAPNETRSRIPVVHRDIGHAEILVLGSSGAHRDTIIPGERENGAAMLEVMNLDDDDSLLVLHQHVALPVK